MGPGLTCKVWFRFLVPFGLFSDVQTTGYEIALNTVLARSPNRPNSWALFQVRSDPSSDVPATKGG